MKKIAFLSLVPLLGSAGSVFAQSSGSSITASKVPTTELVDATGFGSSLLESLQPWIVGALGVAVGVLIVYLGWRLFKRFTK